MKALTDFPLPSDLKQLQRFLGLINFYRRFLPGIADTLQPLTDLLRGNPKTLVWSESAAAAFGAAKAALAAATSLVHPLPGAVISLTTDAFDTHIGGVLQQLSAGSWKPLAFFSRKLSSTESKYSTFDRELLAVFAAIRHFRFVLEGRPFGILTDHLPLTLAMRRVSPLWSARQVRQLAYVSEFSTDIRHTPGLKNVVADALSRPPTSLPSPISPVPVDNLVTAAADLPPPIACPQPTIDYAAMAASLHGVAHPGVKATVRLVTSKFCWPGIRKYVRQYAQQCLSCQSVTSCTSLASNHRRSSTPF